MSLSISSLLTPLASVQQIAKDKADAYTTKVQQAQNDTQAYLLDLSSQAAALLNNTPSTATTQTTAAASDDSVSSASNSSSAQSVYSKISRAYSADNSGARSTNSGYFSQILKKAAGAQHVNNRNASNLFAPDQFKGQNAGI